MLRLTVEQRNTMPKSEQRINIALMRAKITQVHDQVEIECKAGKCVIKDVPTSDKPRISRILEETRFVTIEEVHYTY